MRSGPHKAKILFALLWFSASVIGVSGQDNYRIQRISVNDGLSQGDVRCIIQDKDGFLWIGTRDGLNRYDGNKFLTYLPESDDSTSLAFNQITALTLDTNKNLWIGTTDGIALYHPGSDSFTNFPFDQNTDALTEIHHMFTNDTSLVLSTNNGLMTFGMKSRSYRRENQHSKFRRDFITQYHESRERGRWVATSKGLHYKEPGDGEWRLMLKDTIVHDILFDSEGIFISTNRGLFKFTSKDNALERISLPHSRILQVMRSSSGQLWVAADKVFILDSKDDMTLQATLSHDGENPHTLSEDRAQFLYQSTDGAIWIGTFGYGLNKFIPSTNLFSYFGDRGEIKLSSNYISGIYTADDVEIFIGTTRGLNFVDIAQMRHELLLNDGGMNLIFTMKADKDGVLWISSAKGLYRYDRKRFTKMNFQGGVILNITDLDENTILLTTYINGIFLMDRANYQSWPLISPDDLPRTSHAAHLFQDQIWVGSDDGLRIFSKDGVLKTHFRSRSGASGSLPVDVVKTIFEDKHHRLWIGTWGGGFCLFNPSDSTFKTHGREAGLPNNVVYGILEDNNDNLWLSTNGGISVFNQKNNTFTNFDYLDGLQGNEFNTSAYFKSINGKMYFGGVSGLSFFDPEEVLTAGHVPAAKFLNVTINDRQFPLDPGGKQNTVKTDWRRNNIGLEFTTIDFRRPDKIQFQYSINDEPWFNLDSRRHLELVNLAAGRHEVKLRTRVEGGAWSDASETLIVNVMPPWWRDPFVLTAAAAALLLLTYLGHRARIRFLKNINVSLNNTVLERTREIQIKKEEIESQNEEIQAQNEELTRRSDLLAEKNQLLEKQGEELLVFSNDLEKKVNERTKHIQLLNEELTEQNVQLEQFSFIAAHNFRGPLARIRGLIGLLKESGTSEEDLRLLITYLETSSNELDQVIGDMSRILRLKKDSGELFEKISLGEILDRTLLLLSDEIRDRSIRIDRSDFKDLSIHGSAAYAQSIFYNLIENAIRYSNPDLLDPFVKITSFKDGDRVGVQIIDNGVGIDMNLAMSKIFQLYQRFNTHSAGRGLGLYLVKTQIEIMGGSVRVESQVGKGTTFSLIFKPA